MADDGAQTGMDEAMRAFLRAATDDDIARLARVISPALDLTPGQRRSGFDLIVADIFSRADAPDAHAEDEPDSPSPAP